MAEKNDDNSKQVQREDVKPSNSPSGSNPKPNNTEASEDNNQDTTDQDMKRAPLSRSSTLESIREEDSELEEKYMLDSFKSITDVFENGYEEEKAPSKKSSPAATPLTSKSASLSISEDTDSLDEEVRQIMQRSEEKKSQNHEATNEVAINSLKNVAPVEEEKKTYEEEVKEEEKEIPEEYDTDDESEESSVPTDTESISETESETESERMSDDEKTGHWSLRRGDDSSDEEDDFDLDEHINKMCRYTGANDYHSTSESDLDSDSEGEKQKAINKVMRMYNKKYPQEEESESESDYSDDSSVEETDLEDNASNDGIKKVEIKDDDSSDYSSSDDDIDSDFLDDDSPSVSSESSSNGDYELEELEHDKDAVQGVSEEIPYLSDPAMPSHEVVFKYYLGNRPESCPEKIEVQDGDLNNNIALDNTLATRSVINLRWPFTSYYVKEFDLDSEAPTYEENGLLPCYKSMKSSNSASFPGRRRDVMLGRVWWVEWWARDAVKDQEEEEEEEDGETNNPVKEEEELEEDGEMGQFERERINTQL